jgi:4-amino-4-deoxy-L-arabinose transferase-like glycosyltransferase
MLARDDWISLWWAQDKWFWSKPIYIFWSEGLLWSASGLDYKPDSHFVHSEWVLRLPTYAVSMLGLLCVHAAIRKLVGARAAVLAALVLATTPYYGFLTHQAITDMPFVGTMTAALMMLLLAVNEDPEREVQRYRLGPLSISGQEIAIGLVLMLALPQVLYLASRNITLLTSNLAPSRMMEGVFAWHLDEFLFGSGHNRDVPGNFGLHTEQPRYRSLFVQPLAQALLWALCTAFIVWRLQRERRAQALYMIVFFVLCGLSFMAKGIPGFALPGLVALLYLLCCRRWQLLFEGRLKIALGALTLVTLSLPWFVAMYVRHGAPFTNRILVHDHLNRLAKGVHGDTGSIQYFIAQLGYGMFPWMALTPVALGAWLQLRRSSVGETPEEQRRRETLVVIGLWFIAAFTLYSAMITKFHHYIFPVVPAAAVLIGVVLDRMLGSATIDGSGRSRLAFLLGLLASLPLVLGVGGARGNLRGWLPSKLSGAERDVWVWQHAESPALWLPLLLLGVGLLVAGVWLQRKATREREEQATADGRVLADDSGLAAGLLAGAALGAFVGRDLSWITAKRPAGYERLIDLFVYNYDRPWPSHFDYRPILTGFAVVGSALVALAALRALRPILTSALLGLCLAFSVFTLDVYMMDLSPHWSQKPLIERYYRERKGPQEPLVAWQMNWKGENFYTGNRVSVFVDLDNKALQEWIGKNPGKVAYFVLEHGRFNRLKGVLGSRPLKALTTERDNNKFVLAKVKL